MNRVPVSAHANDLDDVPQVDDRRAVDTEKRWRRQAILERVESIAHQAVAATPVDSHIVIGTHDPRDLVRFVEECPVAIDK